MARDIHIGPLLRAYLWGTALLAPVAPAFLRRRLARGKEDPERWREKLGETQQVRPAGSLVWLHAVGLGEVLALRGLTASMSRIRPDMNFLVTSSARSSARAFAANLPPRTRHQFLPLDAKPYIHKFLDHWRPDLSVWAEQDLWPGLVVETHHRQVPLALVNARMDARAYAARLKAKSVYRALYRRFSLCVAQDAESAKHVEALGAINVGVMGSLKASAPPLADLPAERSDFEDRLSGRMVWCAASTHAEDEAVALEGQLTLQAIDHRYILILAPRDPARAESIAEHVGRLGLKMARRSLRELPTDDHSVFLADSFGEMGLWYRLCSVALMGGSFGPVNGHNPWEPAHLGAAILHGPEIGNFALDYAAFDDAGAAVGVADADGLVTALTTADIPSIRKHAKQLAESRLAEADDLADQLISLMAAQRDGHA